MRSKLEQAREYMFRIQSMPLDDLRAEIERLVGRPLEAYFAELGLLAVKEAPETVSSLMLAGYLIRCAEEKGGTQPQAPGVQ